LIKRLEADCDQLAEHLKTRDKRVPLKTVKSRRRICIRESQGPKYNER